LHSITFICHWFQKERIEAITFVLLEMSKHYETVIKVYQIQFNKGSNTLDT